MSLTPQTVRLRRSVLYMPANNERAIAKARSLAADAVILDLEDAVAPDAKVAAREAAIAAVQAGGFGRREVAIRVNDIATEWGPEDLAAVATSGADAVVLPKVESAGHLVATVERLDAAGAPAQMGIWAMIETPRGVLEANRIAASCPRLTVLVMGTSDLAKDLRVPHTPDRAGLQVSLQRCVLAARAHGLDIIDGVHLDLEDTGGLLAACQQGRNLGFDGKSLIHPRQIDAANGVFGVSGEEAARARRIVEGWDKAVANNQGVAVVDGQLVESLHVEEARRILALYSASEQESGE